MESLLVEVSISTNLLPSPGYSDFRSIASAIKRTPTRVLGMWLKIVPMSTPAFTSATAHFLKYVVVVKRGTTAE